MESNSDTFFRNLTSGTDILDDTVLDERHGYRAKPKPQCQRIADVTPIFKKGRRGDLENYRHVPGKMVESLIQDKILKHIEEQALLRENQHGFFKGCWTGTRKI
ncbi:uncharacterized protein LOC144586986 isoform X2 [Pogona vitticeps]